MADSKLSAAELGRMGSLRNNGLDTFLWTRPGHSVGFVLFDVCIPSPQVDPTSPEKDQIGRNSNNSFVPRLFKKCLIPGGNLSGGSHFIF